MIEVEVHTSPYKVLPNVHFNDIGRYEWIKLVYFLEKIIFSGDKEFAVFT